MAVTDGRGNGFWTRDETILALDLYLKAGKALDGKDPRVQELSAFLRSLPLHPPENRKNSFRNPDGVAFKIANLRAVQTGNGLTNVSSIDKEVWAELGPQPTKVAELAAQIRLACESLTKLPESKAKDNAEDDQEYFAEGGASAVLHRRLERNRGLRAKLLKQRQASGALKCDACDRPSIVSIADLETAAFEAHHVHPLADAGQTKTSVADLALLCATCHRLIHRAMIVQKRWIALPDFKALIESA